MSIDHFVWGEGGTLERSSNYGGILNVSARPRINLPGRSDRVVKHSHHVSFALITKSLTQLLIRTLTGLSLSPSCTYSSHPLIACTPLIRLRLNTIVDYNYVQLTISYCESSDEVAYEVISRIIPVLIQRSFKRFFLFFFFKFSVHIQYTRIIQTYTHTQENLCRQDKKCFFFFTTSVR